jgi:signal transduction histidine kinase
MSAPLQRLWRSLSLSKQFAIVATTVILLIMSAIGSWVTTRIQDGVAQHAAAAAALYVDAQISPIAQELGTRGTLSDESVRRLDAIIAIPEFRENIAAFKIWLKGGVVAYSNFKELIGQQFTPSDELKRAWLGQVAAQADGLGHDDEHREREMGYPLIEIYAPIRENGTSRIIAVSEFYMRADAIRASARAARAQSWAIVGGAGLLLALALYAIVRRGSNTIVEQQRSLEQRARQNEELSRRIERAYWRADRLNEHFLRRVGSDLHDGPAQLLGLALMRLDDLPIDQGAVAANPDDRVLDVVRGALEDAIREIRNMSRGLMLPELDDISINEMVEQIVKLHIERTGSTVSLDLPDETVDVAKEYKVCAYRFLQEALNNAHRHAPGSEQTVSVKRLGAKLQLEVGDNGPGMKVQEGGLAAAHLGLVGIRDRVETLNGRFEVHSRPGNGTILRVVLDTSRPILVEA